MAKRLKLGAAALAAGLAMSASPGAAKVASFEIVNRIAPAFGGQSYGEAGTYERIDAIVHLAIDPESPCGRSIVDLDKAPRNAEGLVEYSTEVTILRPMQAGKGNGALF